MPPLLGEIVAEKAYFHSHLYTPGARILLHNRVLFGNDKRLTNRWNLNQIPERKDGFHVLRISAVTTIEQKYSFQINGKKGVQQNHRRSIEFENTLEKDVQYLGYESEELDDREKLRRKRISKANSGKTPWNKGRKHSAETKLRIKERTRIAMQNPKVKMKLANVGHAQSDETRVKIGVSVRTMWEKRREKLTRQEMCRFEWQNLVADTFRRGFSEEEELQWDSYEKLDEELKQEWIESIEQRKQTPRPKGHRRAPKPLEQRKKIAAAIAAKWADPGYRERVQSALSKYHKSPARAERQPKRKPRDERQTQPRIPRPRTTKANDTCTKQLKIIKGAESNQTRLRKRNVPMYKDPLASAKLEMIKNIKAQRTAAGTKKSQAIEQAKILIGEAEKAAKALEAAALRSPLAQASLSETRNLIAEAIQSLQSIEVSQTDFSINDQVKTNNGSHVNGEVCEGNIKDFGFGEFNFKELVNGEVKEPSMSYKLNGLANKNKDEGLNISGLNGHTSSYHEVNGHSKHDKEVIRLPNGTHFKFEKEEMDTKPINVPKKWICGRLVEVKEGDKVSVQ